MISCLYRGSVRHVRHAPRRHRLRYRGFWLLLDLDEVPALAARLRLFSRDRFNLFGFTERDHGDGTPGGLRGWVARQLDAAGLAADGPVRLLTMPRVLGYVFNPISIFFCHRADGALVAILYEVRNTFGQRHSYLIAASNAAGPQRQTCHKELYVSPFMPMEMLYTFRIAPPAERVAVAIEVAGRHGRVLTATLAGRRAALTDATLLRAFLAVPLLTLKVVAAIHWQALLIWRKGVALQPRPAPPLHAVTFIRPDPV